MIRTLSLLIFVAVLSVAQTTVNVKSLTLSADATAAVNNFMVTQVLDTTTGLSAGIDNTTTAVQVADGSVVSGTDIVKIDGEAMQITAKTGRNLTVTRGVLGTTPAAHSANAIVQVLKYKTAALLFQQHIANMVAEIMDQVGYPTKATQDAVIATARAAKDAAKLDAVK